MPPPHGPVPQHPGQGRASDPDRGQGRLLGTGPGASGHGRPQGRPGHDEYGQRPGRPSEHGATGARTQPRDPYRPEGGAATTGGLPRQRPSGRRGVTGPRHEDVAVFDSRFGIPDSGVRPGPGGGDAGLDGDEGGDGYRDGGRDPGPPHGQEPGTGRGSGRRGGRFRKDRDGCGDDPYEDTAPSSEPYGDDAWDDGRGGRAAGTSADEDGGERARTSKGRTFTGVAAAAVTTVLAVVVAGQVAEGPPRPREEPTASGDVTRDGSTASRSQGRPAPEGPGGRSPAVPASLHERLDGRFPLAENLALSGSFATVGGKDEAPGTGTIVRYRIDVEKGLPLDGELFAELVQETLNDPRSWGHGGTRTFERVSSGPSDFALTLASPGTTHRWCAKSGLDTDADNVSCDSASTERVMINAYRWAQGAPTYGDDMLGYRQMLINHEVGHRLGHDHLGCPKDGAPAPVMMQQTKYLTSGGATCEPNPWVSP